MSTTPRRVVVLGRVSTDDKGQNPENQLAPLRTACARLLLLPRLPLDAGGESTRRAAKMIFFSEEGR